MKRSILILAGALLLAGSAMAEDAVSTSGRYQIAPDGDGFVRLDTESGALTHCDKSEGVWRCRTIVEERSDLDLRIMALGEDVASLRSELGGLAERLGAIEESLAPSLENPPAAAVPSPEAREREFDQALSFAERMMRRFFDMIRELKNEEPPQQI